MVNDLVQSTRLTSISSAASAIVPLPLPVCESAFTSSNSNPTILVELESSGAIQDKTRRDKVCNSKFVGFLQVHSGNNGIALMTNLKSVNE